MGGTSYSRTVYDRISTTHSTKSRSDIFVSRRIDPLMDPRDIKVRESRDSEANPEALPIIVALDETGSMGDIPEALCKGTLGTLIETIIKHKVPYPATLFMGIGDHYSDEAPLQVGQFESGAEELDMWLTKVYLEGSGGPFGCESYPLAWLFASKHTSHDHFEKRGKKGYLFTIGDEDFHTQIEAEHVKKIFGYGQAEGYKSVDLLKDAQEMYEVFHIHINSASGHDNEDAFESWKEILGQNFLLLEDHNNVAELIATTVAVMEGAHLKDVVKDFDSKVAGDVSKALVDVKRSVATSKDNEGIMEI